MGKLFTLWRFGEVDIQVTRTLDSEWQLVGIKISLNGLHMVITSGFGEMHSTQCPTNLLITTFQWATCGRAWCVNMAPIWPFSPDVCCLISNLNTEKHPWASKNDPEPQAFSLFVKYTASFIYFSSLVVWGLFTEWLWKFFKHPNNSKRCIPPLPQWHNLVDITDPQLQLTYTQVSKEGGGEGQLSRNHTQATAFLP